MLSIQKTLLNILGDIKIFKFPFFMVYDPGSYLVKGEDLRTIEDVIKPGDILLRAYANYLDGKFIRGAFSHAAFYYGENKVYHAIAEGIIKEDILTWSRCDYICLLRFETLTADELTEAQRVAASLEGKEYDFDFKSDNDSYYCSEYVRKIYEHKAAELQVEPVEVKYLGGLLKRNAIPPDNYLFSPALYPVFANAAAMPRIDKLMKSKGANFVVGKVDA